MVNFGELIKKAKAAKIVDPIAIFSNLDKESGKEYLRPVQETVLKDWFTNHRHKKDLIIKLHTGQGKTLLGLIILQSYLNEGQGPAMYICPNSYLVNQTVEQARQFGIKTAQFTDTKPPQEFLNSEAVLVATCNKLFNGKSVFGVQGSWREPVGIGALVIDDAHKCLDIIKDSFSVRVGSENPIYGRLWALFEDTLNRQAPGTCSDLKDGKDCFMAVPFWSWFDKQKDVLKVLSEYKESDELLFVWDLLKDHLSESTCIFSGERLEITPRLVPVDLITSFTEAKKRIFLSATLTEDAFLVRDLGVSPECVLKPLSSGDVLYSGERLILIPSLVDTSLRREVIIKWVQSLARKHGNFGVVAIVPSFNHASDWEGRGGKVTRVREIYKDIEELKRNIKAKTANDTLVLVNEYDGVDLPDTTCRILTLDSLPIYNTLSDKYSQGMRPNSSVIRRQLAQRIEQGMGRAIRGSSDWCIVVVTGTNITDFLSENSKRVFLSKEAQAQIKIGEELAGVLKKEGGKLAVLEELTDQCLTRDEGWKEYYREKMSEIEPETIKKDNLDRELYERSAEKLFQQGQYSKAAETLQQIGKPTDPADDAWVQQMTAIYLYPLDRTRSMDVQTQAYSSNSRLFRPEVGISYSKLTATGSRATRILEQIKSHESFNALIVELNRIIDNITFNSPSDSFEEGIKDLGRMLGFQSQRPEKETGEGPDNLWHIGGKNFWLIECKNMVSAGRKTISKSEIGQISNSIGWFSKYYEGDHSVPFFIHPAQKLAKDAHSKDAFWVVGKDELEKLKENTLKFYQSLIGTTFDSITTELISRKLRENNLDTERLEKTYLKRPSA